MNAQLLRSFPALRSLTLLISVFALLSGHSVSAQCTDVTLSTQQQVDDFAQSGCTTISGDLIISGADIVNLNGLSQLTSVRSDLQLKGNSALINIGGLSNLHSVGNLIIENNKNLASLEGVGGLTTCDELTVQFNPNLASLSGLNSLTKVLSELNIAYNNKITDLTGLSSLTVVNYAYIEGNPALTSLAGLSGLSSIIGGLYISANSRLNDLTALSNLTYIGANLNISSNEALASLEGLGKLSGIDGDLIVERNSKLASLTGLSSLTLVSMGLAINSNDALTSLTGLSSLTSVGEGIEITNNRLLSNCAVAALCDGLAKRPQAVTIQNNAAGCASKEEVQSRCPAITLTDPNPASLALCAGASLTFSLTATGSVQTFQWYKDDAPLPGQTSHILTLTNVTPSASGVYRLVAANAYSSQTSNPFTLTVNPNPVVRLNASGVLSANTPAVTLTASSDAPAGVGVSYRFSTGATPKGTNQATVTTSGVYSVTATRADNGCSASASTSVQGASSPSACRGTSASINLTVAGSPTRYEWYVGVATGQPLRDGSTYQGATTASLRVVSVTQSQVYYARVFYADGSSVVYGPYRVTLNPNCGAREAAGVNSPTTEPGTELRLTLLGNPVQDEVLRAQVSGAQGQRLYVQLLAVSGRPVHQQLFESAESAQLVEWTVQAWASGLYLLRASTPTQQQTLKVIKP